jgi:NADH:quinone reductase (non-electrogenic)
VKTKIVIAGGGFAGLNAAMYFDRTLARRCEADVVLISRENFILFTPMLHEVAAGDLQPSDIVNPLRRILRHVKVVEADVDAIDLRAKKVSCVGGIRDVRREFEFDHLLLALGSETNFFDMADVRDWAATMKTMSDAALLHNTMVALLETAALQDDASARRQLLTFVVAGGGFAGVETTGAVNDFIRETARYYPSIAKTDVRVVLIHPERFLLPELGEELGLYAERKLRERRVDVLTGVRVASYDGSMVALSDGTSVPASTLVWTAGVKPSAVIASLPCDKERDRLRVDEYLAVPGVSGLWAAGDCAAVPDLTTGKFCPPTAQHGLRQGVAAAKNIEAAIGGRALKAFRYRAMGLLASIGHYTGVAKVFGVKFSGFIAWWLWRTVYLAKLPGLAKKLRVMVGWTLDLFFGKEIEQMITLRDVELLSDRLARLRSKAIFRRAWFGAEVSVEEVKPRPKHVGD